MITGHCLGFAFASFLKSAAALCLACPLLGVKQFVVKNILRLLEHAKIFLQQNEPNCGIFPN